MKKIAVISNASVISRSEQKSLAGGSKTRWICSSNFCGVCAISLAECQSQCYGGTCSPSPVCPLCPIFLD